MDNLRDFRTPNDSSNSKIFGTFASSLLDRPEKVEKVVVPKDTGNELVEFAEVVLPRRNKGPLRLSVLLGMPFIVDVKVESDLFIPLFPKCGNVLTEYGKDAVDSRDSLLGSSGVDGVLQLLVLVEAVRLKSGTKLRSVNDLKKLEYLYVGGALVGLPYSNSLIVGIGVR